MSGTAKDISIAFACVSNNQNILNDNLMHSPAVRKGGARLHIERDAPSASIGYNRALDATTEDLIVFLHHDVFLPTGWDDLLRLRVSQVERLDPNWAVIGAYGVGEDLNGYGPVWSTSLGQIVGRVPERPVPVQSFDEMLFVLRRATELRFDEKLEGFHFYGTDIVQTAAAKGLRSYSMPLPCVHNDKFKESTDQDFRKAYHYMRRKWRARLPVHSPVVKISWHGLSMVSLDMRNARDKSIRLDMAQSVSADPESYAALCGWNDLSPRTI